MVLLHLIPLCVGSMCWTSRLHTARSCVCSHVLLDLVHPSLPWPAPLPRPLYVQVHLSFSHIPYPLHITCPNHANGFSCTFLYITPTFVIPLILSSSYLIQLRYSTNPTRHSYFGHIQLLLFFFFFAAPVSAPHVSAGLEEEEEEEEEFIYFSPHDYCRPSRPPLSIIQNIYK